MPRSAIVLCACLAVCGCSSPRLTEQEKIEAVLASVYPLGAGRAYLVSKQEATPEQRQIAVQNAKRASARIRAELRHPASVDGGETRMPERRRGLSRMPRYIAVDTAVSPSTPHRTKPVMVYRTWFGSLVGNDVFNLVPTVPVGAVKKFGEVKAYYAGQ